MNRFELLLSAAVLVVLPTSAMAQSSTYYAREHLSTPTTVPVSTPTPTPTSTDGAWSVGEWSSWTSSCSSSAVRLRTVVCSTSAGPAPDASCTAAKPSASEVGNLAGCSYVAGGTAIYGPWASGCSASTTRNAHKQCLRSDGAIVLDSDCTARGVSLDSTETGSDYSACSNDWVAGNWSGWSSTCSATATRTRSVSCQRTDGFVQPDAACVAAKPASSETSNYQGCTYAWNTSAWSSWSTLCGPNATRTRTAWCERSDGVHVTATGSTCGGGSGPSTLETADNYTNCTGVLLNGGFESALTNWTTGGTVALDATAHSGAKGVKLTGQSASKLFQTVNTVVGKTYNVSVWNYAYGQSKVNIYVDNVKVADGANSQGNAAWRQVAGSFVATTSSVVVEIRSANSFSFVDTYVDDALLTQTN